MVEWLCDQRDLAPIQNPITDVQPIAVTLSDGSLAILNGPYKITPIAENACCMSWSPRGDALSFVREDELYVVYLDSGEERKIADEVNINPSNPSDWPVWALEHQAIFFLDTPIRVAWLNGTGSFIPRTKDGNLPEADRGRTLLWSPERRILVFEEEGQGEEPWYGRIWIYTFSEDLKTILDETFIPNAGHSLISWMERGESVVMTWDILDLDIYSKTEDVETFDAVVERYGPGSYTIDQVLVAEYSYPGYTILYFKYLSLERYCPCYIFVTDRTVFVEKDGNPISLADLESGDHIRVMGPPFLDYTLGLKITLLN